jgi:peptidoglycan hydrolase CwlO-like protein
VNQPSLHWNHQPNKSNLQELGKNEARTYSIPTIVNGVSKVNSNAKSEQKYSNSIANHINKLRQTINACNKNIKHRII